MNETTLNQDCMYQSVEQIRELNRVEGFDPRRYMRQLQNDGQAAKYYLDVVYRKLWFRLKYPNGKIVKTLKKLTEQAAIVEARVYLDKNDPEDCFISNALAQKYMTVDDQFGNKYVELAETAAVGRALADAGFGLQFADLQGETDPAIVDAAIEQTPSGEMTSDLPAGSYEEESAGEILLEDNDQLPGQREINEYLEEASGQQTAESNRSAGGTGNLPSAMAGGNASGTPESSPASIQDRLSGIQKNLPVEQIFKMLNRDMAAAIVISAGYHKGKTLGQLSIEKPQSLSWYVNDYKGPDNLLRAGADFLLNAASNKAA